MLIVKTNNPPNIARYRELSEGVVIDSDMPVNGPFSINDWINDFCEYIAEKIIETINKE